MTHPNYKIFETTVRTTLITPKKRHTKISKTVTFTLDPTSPHSQEITKKIQDYTKAGYTIAIRMIPQHKQQYMRITTNMHTASDKLTTSEVPVTSMK